MSVISQGRGGTLGQLIPERCLGEGGNDSACTVRAHTGLKNDILETLLKMTFFFQK